MNWHEMFLEMATVVAKKSKDPSTKVGAIVVSPDNRKITVGYNGLPAGVYDSEVVWNNREQTTTSLCKYDLVIHAEMNAIFNAPFSVRGSRLYCTHKPCIECMKNIAGAGITEVHYLNGSTVSPTGAKTNMIAMYCNVVLLPYTNNS